MRSNKRCLVFFFVSVLLVSGLAGDLVLPRQAASAPLVQSGGVGGCPLFPANNVWNTRIDSLPVDPRSDDYINMIGSNTGVHPDFGTEWEGAPIGIPYTTVPGTQPLVQVVFEYDDESDPGPYPIPPDAPIEGGPDSDGDRHVLVVDRDNCTLYEMWSSYPQADGSWQAGSGAVFDLLSNALRPDTWTSADAAGLPILPGLVRYDEVASGVITHALRFTARYTQRKYVWPARHYASSSTDPARPPLGQRFRLKASFDISGFSPEVQVILTALKTYGMFLADNGSNWYISGAPDPRWNDDVLVSELRQVRGSDFEAVDESGFMLDPDSGQARQADGFTLAVIPTHNVVAPGGVSRHTLVVEPTGQFSRTVTLTADLPPDLRTRLWPTHITPPGQATLVLTDTHTGTMLLPGVWYSVPVTVSGGGLSQTAVVHLLVGGAGVYLPLVLAN